MRSGIDVQRSQDGLVHHKNYQRLGYWRAFRAAYTADRNCTSANEWELQLAEALARAHAVRQIYGNIKYVLFGVSALQAMGVGLPGRINDCVRCHILMEEGVFRPRRPEIAVHRTEHLPEPLYWIDDLPLLHPVAHWLQLRGATVDERVQVGDALLRRQHPFATIDEFWPFIDAARWTPGIRAARSAAALLVPGTDSLYETRTRLALVQAGLPTPVVNYPVYCRALGLKCYLDMAYVAERVAVEYDGMYHVGNREQMRYDANRRRALQDEGWTIITVTADLLQRPWELVRSVAAALDAAAQR